jgi:hypothetical protein
MSLVVKYSIRISLVRKPRQTCSGALRVQSLPIVSHAVLQQIGCDFAQRNRCIDEEGDDIAAVRPLSGCAQDYGAREWEMVAVLLSALHPGMLDAASVGSPLPTLPLPATALVLSVARLTLTAHTQPRQVRFCVASALCSAASAHFSAASAHFSAALRRRVGAGAGRLPAAPRLDRRSHLGCALCRLLLPTLQRSVARLTVHGRTALPVGCNIGRCVL